MIFFIKRLFYFLFPLVFAFLLAVSFIRPGVLKLSWEGYHYETSLFFFLSAFSGIFIMVTGIKRLFSMLVQVPSHLKSTWAHRQNLKALIALKGFIAERFSPGSCVEHVALSQLLKSPTLRDVSEYLLGKVVSTSESGSKHYNPLQCRALCEQAIKRGNWSQVYSLVQEAKQSGSLAPWAFWAEISALINQQQWSKAVTFAQSPIWQATFCQEQRQMIAGALLLEKALQETVYPVQDRLEQQAKALPSFWPLVVYVCENNVKLGEKQKLKLLSTAWEAGQHLPLVSAALKSFDQGKSIDLVSDALKAWWAYGQEDGEQSARLYLAQAYVLSSGKVWGQAENLISDALDISLSREAFLLRAYIQKHGYNKVDLALHALEDALKSPALPHAREIEKILEPITPLLPGVSKFMEKYRDGTFLFQK